MEFRSGLLPSRWVGFADREASSLKGLRVEFPDDIFADGAFRDFHEREAAGTAGLAIDRHDDMGRFCDGGEMSAKISLTCTVRKIPDEQTDCQGSLVKSAECAAASDSIPLGHTRTVSSR